MELLVFCNTNRSAKIAKETHLYYIFHLFPTFDIS